MTASRPARDGTLLGLAVGTSGLAFGAAAVSSGLSVWQTCVLSLLAYTGASQFALAGTIAVGGSLLAGAAGAILLGSRNTLYSLRLAGLPRVKGTARVLLAQGVTDESTALALAQPDEAAARAGFRATFISQASRMSGAWIAVLVTSAGCYALKLAGLTIPERMLSNPRLRRFAELVPVALLAALVAVEAIAKGSALEFDPARLAGLAAAVVALLLRAPFLVVIIAAAAVAAALRLAGVA